MRRCCPYAAALLSSITLESKAKTTEMARQKAAENRPNTGPKNGPFSCSKIDKALTVGESLDPLI